MLRLKSSGMGRIWRPSTALAALCLALAAYGCGETGSSLVLVKPPHQRHPRNRIAEEQPPHPQHLDVASPAQEKAKQEARREATRAATPPESAAKPAAQPKAAKAAAAEVAAEPAPEEAAPPATASSTGSLPPASAGTNGSAVLPKSGESKAITPRNMANIEQQSAAGLAILLNGIALAPPSAPGPVKAAISAANEIVGRPYIWGGGHASWYSRGYDCSGAVSYALGGGGFLAAPLTSGSLESWGAPGPGRWITVYANAVHAYAVIAGLRWDTVGDARGTGPRWHAALPYPEGFVERHPPGY